MDTTVHDHLMGKFAALVDRSDLRSTFPEQYTKHWENQGRSGTVQIFRVGLEDQPCEITYSLFFTDTEEIIQTGIHVKFMGEAIINEVRKGDALEYRRTRRIDPVAFLKENYGTGTPAEFDQDEVGTSFTLEEDEDSEPLVFQAVEQLTGKNEEELRGVWEALVVANAERPASHKISPIVNTWLKHQRDRLDLLYLRGVRLLEGRTHEIMNFSGADRQYTVVSRRMRGAEIRENIDAVNPNWWGGLFYKIQAGVLVPSPHDTRDRMLVLRSFSGPGEFPVEEIYVDDAHIYTAIFAGSEALVWRTRHSVPKFVPGRSKSSRPAVKGKKIEEAAGGGQEAGVSGAPASSGAAAEIHPYVLARAEKVYVDALVGRAPDLNEQRRVFIDALYRSDRGRFAGQPMGLAGEVGEAIARALRSDKAAMRKEMNLLDAHLKLFYAEMENS